MLARPSPGCHHIPSASLLCWAKNRVINPHIVATPACFRLKTLELFDKPAQVASRDCFCTHNVLLSIKLRPYAPCFRDPAFARAGAVRVDIPIAPGRTLQCPATNRSPAACSKLRRSASLACRQMKCNPEDRATGASTNNPSGPSMTARRPSCFAQPTMSAGTRAGWSFIWGFILGDGLEDLPRAPPRFRLEPGDLRGLRAGAFTEGRLALRSPVGLRRSSWR